MNSTVLSAHTLDFLKRQIAIFEITEPEVKPKTKAQSIWCQGNCIGSCANASCSGVCSGSCSGSCRNPFGLP